MEADRRFFEDMVTLLPVAVGSISAAGILLSANTAFVREFSISPGELERYTIFSVMGIGGELGEKLNPREPSTMEAAGRLLHLIPVTRWEQGETEWMVVAMPAAPVGAAAGDPDCAFAETAAAVEAMRRLGARVTHEVNNLSMIASGYGREILEQLPAESPLREDMGALLGATDRIEGMAAQLGAYTHVGAGKIAAAAAEDVLPAGLFTVRGAMPAVNVSVDAEMLRAALGAIASMADRPLEAEAEAGSGFVTMRLRGFPQSAEALSQALEPLNKAAREDQPGAREAVLAGIRILRAGAEWKIGERGTLEIRMKTAGGPVTASARPVAASAPVRPAAAARTAMVVDDQAAIRNIVRRVLEANGYRVVEAASGEEAAGMLSEKLDLLVTDMTMPGMTGRETAEKVRAAQAGVKVVFMSGYTDDEAIQAGVLPERSAFLAKPFTPEKLMEAVRGLG